MVASSLSYTTVLSIIPVLAVSFSIFQAFGGMSKLYATIEPFILQNLAEGSSDEAMEAIRKFIGNIHAGAVGAGGLVGLIVSCMSMLGGAEKGIHQVWGVPNTRSFFHRIAAYWLIITLGPLALAIGLGFATSSDLPLQSILPSGTGIFGVTILLFFLIFKYVPSTRVNSTAALISAALTAVAWNLARILYGFYNAKVLTNSKIYGSLAAIPILLLWIFIAWLIVLTGSAFSVALHRRFNREEIPA